jgi:hypothetical protein
VADARGAVHQIEYRWDSARDMFPVASSLAREPLLALPPPGEPGEERRRADDDGYGLAMTS